MGNKNYEVGVSAEPIKPPKEPILSRLEEFLFQSTLQLVPQSFERLTIIQLDSNEHILNDPSTQEGGAFDHSTRSIILRVRVNNNSRKADQEPEMVVTKDDRSEWVVGFSDIAEDIKSTKQEMPDYLKILLANSVHEATHGLTLQTVWNLNIEAHNSLIYSAQDSINTSSDREKVMSIMHDKLFSSPRFKDPKSAYNLAVERKREMTQIILDHLPEEYHEEYLKIAFYRGMSEIIAFTLQEKIRSSGKNPVEWYTGNFYSVRAAYMVYPTPQQHEHIRQVLEDITLPLTEESLDILRSLGDSAWFEEFKTSTDYNQLFAK